jgi:hypothetical protein
VLDVREDAAHAQQAARNRLGVVHALDVAAQVACERLETRFFTS